MSKFLQILFLLLVLVAESFSLLLNAEAEQLRLGAVLDLSGPRAEEGDAFFRGIELAVDEMNQEAPGMVQLFVEDAASNSKKVSISAAQLVTDRQASVIFTMTESDIMSVSSVSKRSQVISVALRDSSPQIEKLGSYSFGFGEWTQAAGERSADFVYKELGKRSAATVCQHEEWSELTCNVFRDKYKEFGGKIVFGETLNVEQVDFRKVISRLSTTPAEIVFLPLKKNAGEFLRQAAQLKQQKKFITADAISNEMVQRDPEIFEGVYQLETRIANSDRQKNLLARFKERYGKDCKFPQFLAWGRDGATVIFKAWKKSGFKTGPELAVAVHEIKNLRGVAGNVTVNENGSAAKFPLPYRVMDGKIVAITVPWR